jgi:ketosteroid isomerase-like protein
MYDSNDRVINSSGRRQFRRAWLRGLALAVVAMLLATACSGGTDSASRAAGTAAGASANQAFVERFYSALNDKDADGVRTLIEEGFAPDAVNRISESMPYGGTTTGREAIVELFAAFFTTTPPIIPLEQITVERMVGEGDTVAAWVEFPWFAPGTATNPIQTGATEWFTFRDGLVTEMVVSYNDTAACLAAIEAAEADG